MVFSSSWEISISHLGNILSLWGLSLGLLPAWCAQKTSKGVYAGGILIGCPDNLYKDIMKLLMKLIANANLTPFLMKPKERYSKMLLIWNPWRCAVLLQSPSEVEEVSSMIGLQMYAQGPCPVLQTIKKSWNNIVIETFFLMFTMHHGKPVKTNK